MKPADNIELAVRRLFGLIKGGKRSPEKIKFDMAVLHAFLKCHVNHESEGVISLPDIGVTIPVVTPGFAEIAEQCKTYDAVFPKENAFDAVEESVKFIFGISIHSSVRFEDGEYVCTSRIFSSIYRDGDYISAKFTQIFDELELEEINYLSALNPTEVVIKLFD